MIVVRVIVTIQPIQTVHLDVQYLKKQTVIHTVMIARGVQFMEMMVNV